MGWFGPRGECGCCASIECSECASSPLGAMIWPHAGRRVTLEVSGLAASYKNEVVAADLDFCFTDPIEVEVTGLNAFNGTHVFDQPAIPPNNTPCAFGFDSSVQSTIRTIGQALSSSDSFCNCNVTFQQRLETPGSVPSLWDWRQTAGPTYVSGTCSAANQNQFWRFMDKTGTPINWVQPTRCDHSTRIAQNLWQATITQDIGIGTSSMSNAAAKVGEFTVTESIELYYDD